MAEKSLSFPAHRGPLRPGQFQPPRRVSFFPAVPSDHNSWKSDGSGHLATPLHREALHFCQHPGDPVPASIPADDLRGLQGDGELLADPILHYWVLPVSGGQPQRTVRLLGWP